jgi:hypothetical protein
MNIELTTPNILGFIISVSLYVIMVWYLEKKFKN